MLGSFPKHRWLITIYLSARQDEKDMAPVDFYAEYVHGQQDRITPEVHGRLRVYYYSSGSRTKYRPGQSNMHDTKGDWRAAKRTRTWKAVMATKPIVSQGGFLSTVRVYTNSDTKHGIMLIE